MTTGRNKRDRPRSLGLSPANGHQRAWASYPPNGWPHLQEECRIMTKPRVRLSSKGWFYYAFNFMHGVKDFYTGVIMPDITGRVGLAEIWVGPFASFDEAAERSIANSAPLALTSGKG